jgi:ankyrin repeat protein
MLHITSLKGKANAKAIEDALAEIELGGTSLIGAYDKTMKMIELQDEGYRRLAKHTLSWVAFSKTPLTVTELQHALAIEPGKNVLDINNITKLDIIVMACAGLITVQEARAGSTVHLVHGTTQRYFDKTEHRWFGNVRPRLARLSLNYLTFHAFDSGPCEADDLLAYREAQYPLYVYLRRCLPEYIEGHEEDAGVKLMLEKFFLSDMHVQAHMQAPTLMPRYFNGSTGLHAVIIHRMGTLIPFLLTRGANKPNKVGLMPLHLAVLLRFYEGIEALTSSSAVDCNATTQEGRTALSCACEEGDVKSVQLLLACHEIDCNLADESGRTPLTYALEYRRVALVRLLLGHSATDCISPDLRGRVPLAYAVLGGSEDCIQDILERPEVDVNTVIESWTTILHWAIHKRKMLTISYVLGKPSLDVNMVDHMERTPLTLSMENRSEQAARLLLSRKDVKLCLPHEAGPGLLIRAVKWCQPDLMELLLAALGYNILAKDNNYRTALDYAAEYRNWQLVEQLLRRYRTKISIKHRLEDTALYYAIRNGPPNIISLILEQVELEKSWWFIDALAYSVGCSLHDPEHEIGSVDATKSSMDRDMLASCGKEGT